MIDVSILKHPKQDRTVNLFNLINKLACMPDVYIQLLKGYENNIAKGRAEGFGLGGQKYVSFIDDDDDFIPEVLLECLMILENNLSLDGIVTLEKQITPTQEIVLDRKFSKSNILIPKDINSIHHLVIVRREVLNKYLHILEKAVAFPEFTLWGSMLLDGCRFYRLPKVGYIWNNNKSALKMKLPITDYTKEVISKCITGKTNG